jgi:hypothetical protein
MMPMSCGEREVVDGLLRLAADAWAKGARSIAERLTTAAVVIIDGRAWTDTDSPTTAASDRSAPTTRGEG